MTKSRTCLLVLLLAAPPAAAQVVPDAHTIPRGALRVSLSPRYLGWNEVFDTEGTQRPLGRFLDSDSLGSDRFPTLRDAEGAVRRLLGDSTYRMTAGAFRSNLDADIRRVPLAFQVGLTSRITFTVGIPIVNTTMNVAPRLDSTSANVGLNTGISEAVSTLLGELVSRADDLDQQIAAGAFGCPASAQCDQARALVARVRAVAADWSVMTGVLPPGTATVGLGPGAPPFVPRTGSAAAQALTQLLADLSQQIASFGLPPLSSTAAPAPGAAPDTAALATVFSDPRFGYELRPLETTKIRRQLGDIELGLRVGVVQGPHVRALVSGLVRLPTAQRDRPENLLDLPTGDRQLDVEGGFELALEPGGVVALWLGAWYTLQLADEVTLRLTPRDAPLAPAASLATVQRDLGEAVRLSAYPALRLSDRFRLFTTVEYYRKAADRFPGNETLEAFTDVTQVSYGGGLWYRAEANRRGPALPIEAGLIYRAAFTGSGGMAARSSGLEFSLRLFYRLWGAPPTAAAPAEPPAP